MKKKRLIICVFILTLNITDIYAQDNSLVSLWQHEEYEKITNIFEQNQTHFSEKDSAIVAKFYAAQQRYEKSRFLFKKLYQYHPNNNNYLLQSYLRPIS